jgi:hypothetical protein
MKVGDRVAYLPLHAGGDLSHPDDERKDHPNDGPCNLNGLGHGIPSSEPEARCLAYKPVK